MKNKDQKNHALSAIPEPKDVSIAPLVPFISEQSRPMYEDASTLNMARLHEKSLIKNPLGGRVFIGDDGEKEILIKGNPDVVISNPDVNFIFAVARQELFKKNGDVQKLVWNDPICISIDDLILLRGKTPTKHSRQNMRRRLERAGDLLRSLEIKIITNPRNPNGRDLDWPVIFQDLRIKGSNLIMHFSQRYAASLVRTFYLDVPDYLFFIDTRKKNASSLVYKLNHYFQMNLNKEANKTGKNISELEDYRAIIGIPYILKYCPESPSIEEVQEKGRQLNQRIIEPLEKSLDDIAKASGGRFQWQYCNKKKEPLTKKQLNKPVSADEFNKRYILYRM